MMYLIEDLERLQFKLSVEAQLQTENPALAGRLADLATEAADALEQAKALSREPSTEIPAA
jgi:hypothetical protein